MSQFAPYQSGSVQAKVWRRRDRRLFESAPSRHAELVVLLGLAGSVQYYLDGSGVRVDTSSVLLAFSGQAHFLLSETKQADIFVAVISPALFRSHPQQLIACGREGLGVVRLPACQFRELMQLSQRLLSLESGAPLELGVSWWLHELAEMISEAKACQSRSLHPKVSNALELINEAPWRQISKRFCRKL